jgi:hypothetical protein
MNNRDTQLINALHQRLVGQLHGEISGNLFAIRVGLFNVMSALDPSEGPLRLEIQKLKDIVQKTLDSVASVTKDLNTPPN